jgi:hypothetical protein
MPIYFKPRRRKLGVVVLLVTCALTGIWLRNLNRSKSVGVFRHLNNCTGVRLRMKGSQIIGDFIQSDFELGMNSNLILLARPNSTVWESPNPPQSDADIDWKFHKWDFGVGQSSTAIPCAYQLTTIRAPSWFVIWPLTLLSAWLLLSKPRLKNPRPTTSSYETLVQVFISRISFVWKTGE